MTFRTVAIAVIALPVFAIIGGAVVVAEMQPRFDGANRGRIDAAVSTPATRASPRASKRSAARATRVAMKGDSSVRTPFSSFPPEDPRAQIDTRAR
jgi:hypothetical protein